MENSTVPGRDAAAFSKTRTLESNADFRKRIGEERVGLYRQHIAGRIAAEGEHAAIRAHVPHDAAGRDGGGERHQILVEAAAKIFELRVGRNQQAPAIGQGPGHHPVPHQPHHSMTD
jgi:hypothetical protein